MKPYQLCRLATGAGLLLLTICLIPAGILAQERELKPSGQIEIDQLQLAFIFSGHAGGGILHYQGQDFPFNIGGLGIGGVGVSKVRATGNVYNLDNLSDFTGAYAQVRSGLAVGELSTGKLWLRNAQGVLIRLEAEREGLALSIGGDAVHISFEVRGRPGSGEPLRAPGRGG